MVRTQIQLTEKQAKILHDIDNDDGVSMAEIIRQPVGSFIQRREMDNRFLLIERAKEASGN